MGRFRRLLMAVALMCASDAAVAQQGKWRLFTSDDGLPETWVYHVIRGASGRVWTSHGVPGLGAFDGYTVTRMTGPENGRDLSEAPDGHLWMLLPRPGTDACEGVQRLDGTTWERHRIPELIGPPLPQMSLIAWSADRVLIRMPERLLEFDRRTRQTRVIVAAGRSSFGSLLDLQPAARGGAWLSTGNSVVKIDEPTRPASSHVAGFPSLTEHRLPAGLLNATRVIDTERELLVVAHEPRDPSGILLRFEGGAWTRLARGSRDEPLYCAWRGVDDDLWVVRSTRRGFSLSQLREGEQERRVPRIRALSGVLLDVATDPDGGFWLATSLGLVRHLPSSWRTPPELSSRRLHTGSLFESRNGNLFANQNGALLQRMNGRWMVHAVPSGVSTNVHYSQVLGELSDGRIVVGVESPGLPLIFSTITGLFDPLRHPEGRLVEVLGPRRASGVWTITRASGTGARVESYDNGMFERRADLDGDWEGGQRPRIILETRSGELFLTPAPHGIARLRGSRTEWLGESSGLPGAAPFAAVELANGRVWFGGRDGILEFDGQRITAVRSGMQTIRSLIEARDGSVWVASNSGVHRFVGGSWITLTNEEGLPDAAAFDLIEDRPGQLWVSTTSGLSASHVEADRDPPRTVMSAESNPGEAPPSGEVRLVFGAIDRWRHTATERLVYSHRLDAGTWSPFTSDTGVSLSRLAPGPHTFTVRAMDRNWNVDRTPATFALTVLLPWYREPLVMVLSAASGVAVTLAIVLFATRHVRLEREVAERTEALRAELAERRRAEEEGTRLREQLVQSQKMEALGRLAGGISHDFNNLLTVISSYGDLLREDLGPDDPRSAHAEQILQAGSRAAALTRQLLSFSRHQGMLRQVIDLNTAVGDLLRMLARVLGENIELRFKPAEDLCPVLSDRGQLEQVVMNLAVNARDAMPEGGRLEIDTANVELDDDYVREHVGAKPGPHVRLTISDTGVGMDEMTKARIFEPFFTTKGPGRGSGLGLSTVYGIIQQNDGHITVESRPNEGSRFSVFLPRTDARPAPALETERSPMHSGTETILVAEDEPVVRSLAVAGLRRAGYRVIEAPTGEEAIAIIEQQGVVPDMLITDMVMPGMGGRRLAERLKQRWPDLPVLLMSGYTAENPLPDSSDPTIDFLQKPFTPSDLTRVARALLDRRPR